MSYYGIVYIAHCRASGRAYIGQTIRSLKSRWAGHVHGALSGSKDCPALFQAIRKHGPKSFFVAPIVGAKSQKQLDRLEAEIIRDTGTLQSTGYNATTGGSRNQTFSAISRRKMSLGNRRRLLRGDHPFANTEVNRFWVKRACKLAAAKRENLSGKRFGRLLVLRRVRNSKPTKWCAVGFRQWLCVCRCGKIKSFDGRELKRRKGVSCGCWGRERVALAVSKALRGVPFTKTHCKRISLGSTPNLIGRKFGKLLVIRKISTQPVRWKCKCVCGRFRISSTNKLTCGRHTACAWHKVRAYAG